MPPQGKRRSSRGPGRSPGATSSTAQPQVPSRPVPPTHRSVATWTVIAGDRRVSWASPSRWTSQPRPLRTDDPAKVPQPFRDQLLTDRHLNDPPIALTEEERRLLCPLCQVLELHRRPQRQGRLQRAKQQFNSGDVAAALDTLRRHRPDLLRPSSSPNPGDDVVLEFDDDDL
ncbi:uncharacterized protein LOC135399934 [Ornithodoros turicata]|uniref:uncharacterized protein LOC135399934 n=1 Tax=Ornithodoros turicata TaxID=34597 RepID=UPI00313A03F9